MAFYPDELSPIDQIRSFGKSNDLPDINIIKNRRQWKSLVLGKKEMGLNNFATITEEKEEEISSDSSQGGKSNSEPEEFSKLNSGVVAKNKITFAKPRKYITSRISSRKDEENPYDDANRISTLSSVSSLSDESVPFDKKITPYERTNSPETARSGRPLQLKNVLKTKNSPEFLPPKEDLIENYSFPNTSVETQWNKATLENPSLTGWPKSKPDKLANVKHETERISKLKVEDKKKGIGTSKSNDSDSTLKVKEDSKLGKKKIQKKGKGSHSENEDGEDVPFTSKPLKTDSNKSKEKLEKEKSLNMKDVVNVYKNLAYGSKEEIKSFVEKLSFVKDETKSENDKNLLSVMNLKALETKIKNFAKKTGKTQDSATSQGKKCRSGKVNKKVRKAHIERLARHKVVRVPAVSNSNYLTNKAGTSPKSDALANKGKKPSVEEKEPWKYVGMQSALDKAYFVYPAYPPSITIKKTVKKPKETKKKENMEVCDQLRDDEKEKKVAVAKTTKTSPTGPKVKPPAVVISSKNASKTRVRYGQSRSFNTLLVGGSTSSKITNRSSATTVCKVEFGSNFDRKSQTYFKSNESDPDNSSVLVYLHGTKAINVKCPYSDRQFSRVKFFRKDGRTTPLIKGLVQRVALSNTRNVSVRNVTLPDHLRSVRSFDLLDFDEDIQNITDFLHSQNSPGRGQQEEIRSQRRRKEELWKGVSPREDLLEMQQQQQQKQRLRRSWLSHPHDQRYPHHHQHGTSLETSSPDSFLKEISQNIRHLQYLPDTIENRKLIGQFFDELDRRIESSKGDHLALEKLSSFDSFPCPLPILGY